jgi:beta-aspartyl-peptidase (threonine type)
MKRLLLTLVLTAPLAAMAQSGLHSGGSPAPGARVPAIAVHGGTSGPRANLSAELEAQYREGLARALAAGMAELEKGRSSLDAVVAAVVVMEDDPVFNAGKGAVFTNEGRNELDASLMDGRTGMAGAVAGVTTIKNPILAARAVMEKTRHVLLTGLGAEKFARAQNLEIVDPSYFFTQRRWDQLQKAKELERIRREEAERKTSSRLDAELGHSTVGAVAIDRDGNLAAATSTGGLTNKLYGRIGDSPIIGAGTYADNRTLAVSATGTGEFFMRGLVTYDISARMQYQKLALAQALEATLAETLEDRKGTGGVIALDKDGNVRWGFNTPGMWRGYLRPGAKPAIDVFR